ncbi:MAG: hypothetical protein KGK07_13690 [Chloroflexota bacterium]|nr:hypothetical protein [Chloroflexota bacterium]
MPGCHCTKEQLAAAGGHIPGCIYHRPRALDIVETTSPAPAPPETRAEYSPPALTPITPGDARYPVAHALALLVRARPHVPEDLAGEIDTFLHSAPPADMPPPTPSTGADDDDLPDFGPELEAFRRMPGSVAGERAQVGPVMPAPPPPKPAFIPPVPRAVRRPPYSNGCAHPGQRLQPNGRGVTCLDCSTEFPGFAAP